MGGYFKDRSWTTHPVSAGVFGTRNATVRGVRFLPLPDRTLGSDSFGLVTVLSLRSDGGYTLVQYGQIERGIGGQIQWNCHS